MIKPITGNAKKIIRNSITNNQNKVFNIPLIF
jgi:hypothetical protein